MQGLPQVQQPVPASGGFRQQQTANNMSASQAFEQPPNNDNQVDADQLFGSTPSAAVNNNTDTADQLFSTTPAITEQQQQVNSTDGQTTVVLAEGANDNMTQPTTTSENEYQPSIVNDQQPQVEGLTTDKNDTAADNIDDIPNEGSEEISGEMQSIQL